MSAAFFSMTFNPSLLAAATKSGLESRPMTLQADVGNLLRQHAIAATHVQDVFAGSWGEQFEDRRTEVGDEACVLGVAL